LKSLIEVQNSAYRLALKLQGENPAIVLFLKSLPMATAPKRALVFADCSSR